MSRQPGDYDAAYYAAREGWLDRRIEAAALLRAANVGPGDTVLEVGCGGGTLLSQLDRRGARPVGVEVNATAARLARERVPAAAVVVIGTHIDLPFADGSFDAVVSQHVLEHLDRPVERLRAWSRLLTPGGRLALVTPNRRYPDHAHFFDPDHRHLWTADEALAACAAVGLREARAWTLFPYLGRGRVARALSTRLGSAFWRLPAAGIQGRTLLAVATL